MLCLVAQSCLTLWHPKDCSPPGFSVHGILQAKILEWIASPLSRGTSRGARQRKKKILLIRPLTFTLSQPSRQENNAAYLNPEGLPWRFRWWRIWLQCRRPRFDPWVRRIRWRRDRLPTPVFLGFPCGSAGKESDCSVGDLDSVPGWEDHLEKGKATHSSILAWRIPWTV